MSVLIDIACNKDESFNVRKAALERVADEDILIDTARNDSNSAVRKVAVKKINNVDVLVHIARKDHMLFIIRGVLILQMIEDLNPKVLNILFVMLLRIG